MIAHTLHKRMGVPARAAGALALFCLAQAASRADTIQPYNVNDNGLIVGEIYNGTSSTGFVYNPAGGSFTLIVPPGATNSEVVGINNNGQLVGGYTTTSGNFGFLYSGGTYTTIGVSGAYQSTFLNSGGTTAEGINNNGEIVGHWYTSAGAGDGFVYSGGTFTNTGVSDSPTFTSLYDVNDSGVISGYTFSSGPGRQGFIDNGGVFTAIAYPGATQTVVQGINNSGEVVGFYFLGGTSWGFIYSNGIYTSIAYPNSSSTQLFGINNLGEIVGTYTCNSCPSSDPAFFATPAGNGYAFTTFDAPEPASMALLGSGSLAILGLFAVRARRKEGFSVSSRP